LFIGEGKILTTSIVECPHCNYRFNYEFIPGASFGSIRLGPIRIFKCPNCKELHNFKITHFGTDPSLPTHGDNSETSIGGKIWAMLLGPLLTLVAISVLLLLTFQHPILFIIPLALGIAWPVVYTAYLYRKDSQYKDRKLTEAK
jgi:hypothetical protein